MSKRPKAAPAPVAPPPPSPRQDSHTPLGSEGRGESHALPDPFSAPSPSEASAPDDRATHARLAHVSPEEREVLDAAVEAHKRAIAQAAIDAPLLGDGSAFRVPSGVVVEVGGQPYAAEPSDHPNAPEGALLLEPVALEPNVARAYREEQLALAAEDAEVLARRDSALAAVQHMKGSFGFTVRREPDEVGHPPRFTLLGVEVRADGQASVSVLVPVAPWHHVADFLERHLRTSLTPVEYR